MNTIWADTDGVHDDLMDGAALRDWVAIVYDQGAQEIGDPSREELDEARLLRDSLRRLAAFRIDDPRPAAQSPIQDVDEAVAAVNRATTHRPYPQLTVQHRQLQSTYSRHASPTRTALAELAHAAVDLLAGPRAADLRACHAPGCVLYFLKSHPRRAWCSEACGNRARAARHYQRVRAAAQNGPTHTRALEDPQQ